MERPADAIVEEQYRKVLAALLLPEAAAAKLIETEPIGKKWQTITMNMGLLSDKRAAAAASEWGAEDRELLEAASRRQVPPAEAYLEPCSPRHTVEGLLLPQYP